MRKKYIQVKNVGIVCKPYLDFIFILIRETIKVINNDWARIMKIEKGCITLCQVGSTELIKIEWKEL